MSEIATAWNRTCTDTETPGECGVAMTTEELVGGVAQYIDRPTGYPTICFICGSEWGPWEEGKAESYDYGDDPDEYDNDDEPETTR